MQQVLVVGLGGALGAIARFLVTIICQRMAPGFPWATLLVNVVGCFALGLLLAMLEPQEEGWSQARLFIGVGLLGAFTTFSTFGVETLTLIDEGRISLALLSVAGNLSLGLAAVLLGRGAARLWGA
ncbi:MAG: fluoride efflux transporter CrcB [Planctomycetota bacterium]|jgi:CrcB protein